MKNVKKRKIIALMTVVIMIVNMFSPYGVLFSNNTVEAAKTGIMTEKPLIFNNLGISTKNGHRVLKMELAINSDQILYGIDMKFSIDKTKIVPCNKNTGVASTSVNLVSQNSDYCLGTFQIKEYDSNAGTFRITITEPKGGTDVEANGYIPGTFGDPAIDDAGSGFNAYYPLIDIYFQVLDDSITTDNIPLSLFNLVPVTASLPTGIKISWGDYDGVIISRDVKEMGSKGFVTAGEKTVQSIAVKTNPTKTTYNHGDTIDLTGGAITVTYSDDSTEDMDMTDSNITVSSSTADVNNPNITLTYKSQTATLPLTVNDPVDSLNVSSPMAKTEYNESDNIDFTGLKLQAVKRSGATADLTQTSDGVQTSESVASINSSNFTQTSADGVLPKRGTQKINFTYQGQTATQTIVVNDKVSSINIENQPTKKVYKLGETLNLSGAKVKVVMASGDNAEISLPDGSVTVTGFDNTKAGKQNLSVNFGTATAADTINVETYNYVVSSGVIRPTNRQPLYNQELDLTGGSFVLTWKDGTKTQIPLTTTGVTISNYDKTLIGVQTVTAKYDFNYTLTDSTTIPDSVTGTFDVNVINKASSAKITVPTDVTFNHGSALTTNGGSILVTYLDGTTMSKDITSSMITETATGSSVNMSPDASTYDSSNKLTKNLTITYTEDDITQTATYDIAIINSVKLIAMQNLPKSTYNINDELDVTGGNILVTRQTGDDSSVALTKDMISGFDSSTEGNKLLTVKYSENGIDKTTTYNITVKDSVKSISVKQAPSKTTYKYGEDLDLSDGIITVEKGSGSSDVSMSQATITDYDKTKIGEQTVTLAYEGQTTTINVTVQDYIKDLNLVKPTKTEYTYGDNLDLTGGSIQKVMASGAEVEPVALSAEDVEVTGYSKTTVGTQDVTVSYAGLSKVFSVNVKDPIQSISVTTKPQTQYGYDDSLNVTGGKITVTTLSGATSQVNITADMVSGYDFKPTFDDTQKKSETLTVTYQGNTATYDIDVINKLDSIVIKDMPKTTYNVNDTLDVTDGTITVKRQTGDDSVVTITKDMVSGFDSSAESNNQVLTVKYSENGIDKTTTYNVVIKDSVKSVAVKQVPSKTTYKYGEDLDLSDGVMTVVKGSGSSDISMSQATITDYDKTKVGTQNVTITYGGQSTTMEITVQDYVKDLNLVEPTKTEYTYGDNLDLTGGSIQKVMASGAEVEPVALSADGVEVTGYSKTTVGAQDVTVSYAGLSKIFSVNVKDPIQSILVTTKPQTQYGYDDSLNVTGGKITATTLSGATSQVNITADMVSGYDFKPTFDDTQKKSETLTVTYQGNTATYDIDVINKLDSIVIKDMPKTTYNVNDTLDVTGGTIIATRQNGNTTKVNITSDMVSGFDSSAESNNQVLTVKYSENGIDKTTTYNIAIKDSVIDIAISQLPTKTTYKYGENLDLTGGKITVQRGSGNVILDMSKASITGYDKTQLGTQNITLTYGDKTATMEITVQDYVKDLNLVEPSKTKYIYGDNLDLTGGSIQKVMASGAEVEPVALSADGVEVTGYSKTTVGTQDVTVSYAGLSKIFSITVEDPVVSIKIKTMPKVNYEYDDSLDITAGVITATLSSGNTKDVNMTADMISGFDSTPAFIKDKTKTAETLTVTYQGKTATYDVTVINKVLSIEINNMPKTSYNLNDSLDVTGASIMVTRENGNMSLVNVTESMISGFDTSTSGNKTVTITYSENGTDVTTTYNITVADSITGIEVKQNPSKTEYKYGEDLDLSDGIITVKKGSGNTDMPMSNASITGYDKTKVGTQILTITYGDKTATMEVKVEDYAKDINLSKPSKLEYVKGEALDLADGSVQKVMASGNNPQAVTLTDSSVIVSGFDNTKIGKQTITVEYAGFTKTFEIEIEAPNLVNIAINNLPTKVEYNYGDSIDLTNGSIKATYSDGSTEIIPITSNMISGYDANKLGAQVITITYSKQTTSYNVNVNDYMLGIKLVAPIKTEYNYGEALNLDGGSVQKVMASGNNEQAVALDNSNVVVSGYNETKPGTQIIKVTYAGFDKTFTVKVLAPAVTGITISTVPDKTEYKYGEKLNIANGQIAVTYSDNTTKNMAITNDMITGYDPTVIGNQTVTVTYQGKTATYDVNVKDYAIGISLKAPDKLLYVKNETIDLTNGGVYTLMASGTKSNLIPLTDSDVSVAGFDSTTLGSEAITVSYKGFTASYNITIKDEIADLQINKLPTKTEYTYGQKLDLTGGSIKVIKQSKDTEIVDMTNSEVKVSGYNANKVGAQTITLTYGNKAVEFGITVKDAVKGIKLVAPKKLSYRYGEKLDTNGAILERVYLSGKTEKITDISPDMVSNYNSKKIGTQTLSVSFENNTYNYQIELKDMINDVSLKSPNKTEYTYGQDIDLSGSTLTVVKDSGTSVVNVTKDMIVGYDPKKSGSQVVTVNYNGYTDTFIVTVDKKQEENAAGTVDTQTSNNNFNNKKNTYTYNQKAEETQVAQTTQTTQDNESIPNTGNMTSSNTEKPAQKPATPVINNKPKEDNTVATTSKKQGFKMSPEVILGSIAGLLMILIFILAKSINKVKIIIITKKRRFIAGTTSVSEDEPVIDVEKYIEKYPEDSIQILVPEKIAKKLDNKTLTIKAQDKVIKEIKIKYEEEDIEISL